MNVEAKEKSKWGNNINPAYAKYEPDATNLVLEIQRGEDEKANKEKLYELILEFVSNIVRRYIPKKLKHDIDDEIQDIMMLHIFAKRTGWKESNGKHYYPYVYKYDQNRIIKSQKDYDSCFCGYLFIVLYWKYKTLEEKENKRKKIICTSIDEMRENDEGKSSEASVIEKEIALEAWRNFIADENKRYLIALLVQPYFSFVDYVTGIDEDKIHPYSPGERHVNEKKILAYLTWFIIAEYDTYDNDSEKFDNTTTRKFHTRINEYRDMRIGDVVKLMTSEFMEYLSTSINFLDRLDSRVKRRRMGAYTLLDQRDSIRNTVDEWVKKRMIRVVSDKYQILCDEKQKAWGEAFDNVK